MVPAQRVPGRPAESAFRPGIPIADDALGVDDDHGIQGGVEDETGQGITARRTRRGRIHSLKERI